MDERLDRIVAGLVSSWGRGGAWTEVQQMCRMSALSGTYEGSKRLPEVHRVAVLIHHYSVVEDDP